MSYESFCNRVKRVKDSLPKQNPSKQFVYVTIEEAEQMISIIDAAAKVDKPEQHIPNRSIVLTSFPPQYYCSNPKCYSHTCDWSGWTDV